MNWSSAMRVTEEPIPHDTEFVLKHSGAVIVVHEHDVFAGTVQAKYVMPAEKEGWPVDFSAAWLLKKTPGGQPVNATRIPDDRKWRNRAVRAEAKAEAVRKARGLV